MDSFFTSSLIYSARYRQVRVGKNVSSAGGRHPKHLLILYVLVHNLLVVRLYVLCHMDYEDKVMHCSQMVVLRYPGFILQIFNMRQHHKFEGGERGI